MSVSTKEALRLNFTLVFAEYQIRVYYLSLPLKMGLSVSIDNTFAEILLSPKSWNSCGILLFSSTFVFSIFFCSSEGLLGLGLATLMGSWS